MVCEPKKAQVRLWHLWKSFVLEAETKPNLMTEAGLPNPCVEKWASRWLWLPPLLLPLCVKSICLWVYASSGLHKPQNQHILSGGPSNPQQDRFILKTAWHFIVTEHRKHQNSRSSLARAREMTLIRCASACAFQIASSALIRFTHLNGKIRKWVPACLFFLIPRGDRIFCFALL